MKQIITILFILTILLTACTHRTDYNALLVRSDSLMQLYPDSALHLLENMVTDSLKTEADNAYYNLLITQARDKNFIVQTDDSLIQAATFYYDSIGDKKLQARAHYYAGCVYRDMNRQANAINEFLIAIPLAQKEQERRLLGLIYNNIGYIYYIQDFNEKADSIYRLMEHIGQELKDTALWTEAISRQGSIGITARKSDYLEIEQKLLKAFEIADEKGFNGIKVNTSASLSRLYSRMNQGSNALIYAKQNLALRKDTVRSYQAFFILGEAFYKIGDYDSASIYLKKSLGSKGFGTKADAYMRLSDIACMQGEDYLAREMERMSSNYKDSLLSVQQGYEVLRVEAKMLHPLGFTTVKSLISEHRSILILVTIFFLLVAGIVVWGVRSESARREKQKNMLQGDIQKLKLRREALTKDAYENSNVYTKMRQIIKDRKDKKKTDFLSEHDWKSFVAETDQKYNNITIRLIEQYQLSVEDIRICCLYLTDLSLSDLQYIMDCTRATVYRKGYDILEEKIGIPHKEQTLKSFLKSF